MKNRVIRVDGKKLEPYKKVKFGNFFAMDVPCYEEVRVISEDGGIVASIRYPEVIERISSAYAISLSSGLHEPEELESLVKLVKKIAKALGYKI